MTRQAQQPTKSSWIRETLQGVPSDWEVRPLDALISSDAPICYGILMPGLNISGGIPVVKVKDPRRPPQIPPPVAGSKSPTREATGRGAS